MGRESRAEIDTAVREASAMSIDRSWPSSNPFYAGDPKADTTGHELAVHRAANCTWTS